MSKNKGGAGLGKVGILFEEDFDEIFKTEETSRS